MTLEEERKALEEQRRTLERERREFTRRVEIEDRRLEQQQKLFDMKFKILEEELVKLATERTCEEAESFLSAGKRFFRDSRAACYQRRNVLLRGREQTVS